MSVSTLRTSWTKDPATLGNFLKIAAVGSDAAISIDPSGAAGGASSLLAVLRGAGPVNLTTLLSHSTII